MDSDASSNEKYGPTELDQMIQDEFFDSSDSNEEEDMSMQEEMDRQVKHILNFKGSIKGRRVINRDRASGARLLHSDYFAPTPAFSDNPWFRHRFRMPKPLFLRIVDRVEAHDNYFKLRRDCCGQLFFSAKKKCTAALRMLALGTAVDAVGEMVRMGESTCLKTIVKFVAQLMNFLQMHQNLRDQQCTCSYSMILWSTCESTMAIKEAMLEFSTSNKFYVNAMYA